MRDQLVIVGGEGRNPLRPQVVLTGGALRLLGWAQRGAPGGGPGLDVDCEDRLRFSFAMDAAEPMGQAQTGAQRSGIATPAKAAKMHGLLGPGNMRSVQLALDVHPGLIKMRHGLGDQHARVRSAHGTRAPARVV